MLFNRNKASPVIMGIFMSILMMFACLFISPTSIYAYTAQTCHIKTNGDGSVIEGMSEWDYGGNTHTYDYVWLIRTNSFSNGDVEYEVQAGWGGNYSDWGVPYRVSASNGFSTTIRPANNYKTDLHRGARVKYNSGGRTRFKAGQNYTITFEVVNNSSQTLSKATVTVRVPKTQRTVTQIYYYYDESQKKWVEFKRTATKVNHGDSFTPTNVGSPAGYAPGNNYGVYGSNGHVMDGTVGKTSFQVTDNYNVHVHYYARTYRVTYNGNGGKYNNSSTWSENIKYGANYITQSNSNFFVRKGYTFTGWNERADGKGTDWTSWIGKPWKYTYTYNVNLYAQWKPNQYTITYDGNGGTYNGQPTWSENVTYDSNYTTWDNFFSRPGYAFKGWNTSKDGRGSDWTSWINRPWKWTTTENVRIYALWDAIPVFKMEDFYVIEGQEFQVNNLMEGIGYKKTPTSDFPDKLTAGKFPVKVTDAEDGDITNRVVVTKVTNPNGKTVESVDTSVVGTYTVHYKVTDYSNVTQTATRKITVLPMSTPVIRAGDRYFFKGESITPEMLLTRIEATDKYDGIITSKVKMIHFDNINSAIVGDYEVIYRVTNTSNRTTEKTVIVHIIDRTEDIKGNEQVRFIKEQYLNTLGESSKWLNNTDLNEELIQSMRKNKKEEAVKVYKFNKTEIDKVKDDIKKNGF